MTYTVSQYKTSLQRTSSSGTRRVKSLRNVCNDWLKIVTKGLKTFLPYVGSTDTESVSV